MPQSIAILPRQCVLRTDILVPLPATVDPTGRSAPNLLVPESPSTFAARFQFLAATRDPQNNPIWRTSELVHVSQ